MSPEFADKIIPLDIEQSMRQSFITYAMSVIVSRALPDVRDGLKPVQRRILYAMYESNNVAERPYRKSAKTVGEVLGNYHPHGDNAVYDTMVRLAQDFNLRYPLLDGQGNFGSVDGDPPAAMRYTEARLSRLAGEMLTDIEKETVDFADNFDNSAKEPTVLPSRFPNLLVNGSTGIAVGMATNIPPHNLSEVIDGIVRMIDHPGTTLDELMQIIKGPDFPTAASILGREGIRKAFTTGKGSILIRGKAQIETMNNGKNRIVVTELPYMVNKARLIERIAQLVRDRKVEGITDLRDESDRTGIRLVVELRRDVNANVMLNQLYKFTQLQQSYSINMLALVDGRPRLLNLRDALHHYLMFQKEVIVRRTKHDLAKAEARAHIVEGLLKALDIIDEIIATIRSSPNTETAKERLVQQYGFSEIQAQHILDMQLRRLTALEREKLEEEYTELQKQIEYFRAILASEELQFKIVRTELLDIKKRFGDVRRTRITVDEGELADEDLIADEDVVITMTHTGYIKRTVVSTYRQQKRGGRGVTGMGTKDEDFVEHLFSTTTHTQIFFFTDRGRCFQLKAYEIPEASRTAKGTAIVNLLQIESGEKITAVIPLKDTTGEPYLLFATRAGLVKKTALGDYANVRANGLIAIDLQDDDTLVDVKLTDGNREIILVSSSGHALRFHEEGVRPTGRATRGVKGINLADDDYVVGMDLVVPGDDLLVITSCGIGKRTPLEEYPTYNRGARGVTTINLKPKHGKLVGIKTVREGNDLMIISQNGVLIRISVADVRQIGRNTQGVQIMNMGEDDAVVAVAEVIAKEDGEE